MSEKIYRFYIRQGEFEMDVEGDQNFVENYVAAFLAEQAEIESGARVAKRANPKKAQRPQAKKTLPAKFSIDKAALLDYVKNRNISSDGKRYLCFMAFLKTQGLNEVNAGNIRDCYKNLGIPFKATSRQNLYIMKRYGKVVPGKEPGLYILTEKGDKEAAKLEKRTIKRKPGAKSKAVRQRKKNRK